MNASSTLSRCSYFASGLASPSSSPICSSGYGSTHTDSISGSRGPSAGSAAGPRSTGSARFGRFSIRLSDVLVAIVYSHERSELRPSNRAIPRQARSIVSCIASSAS